MKSIPVAVKVGGAGVLGGGGIAGTGLLIHHKLQFHPTGLDKELIDESNTVLSVDPANSQFALETNKATLTIKVSESNSTLKTKSDNWTCKIIGIAKSSGNTSVTLTDNTTFDKTEQTKLFTNKLGKDVSKKTTQDGFIKSCARNRTESQKKVEGSLTSELKIEIKKPASKTENEKYGFQEEDLKKIFSGDWVNPSNL